LKPQVYVRDGTCVSALPLVLFGGDVDVRHIESIVVVDKWLRLSVAAQHAVLVVALRGKLQEIMRAKIEVGAVTHSCCFVTTAMLLFLGCKTQSVP
jgi:hypothetical protein